MTEAELREKIVQILNTNTSVTLQSFGNSGAIPICQCNEYKITTELIALFTEAMKGYVKLAEDQKFPVNPFGAHNGAAKWGGYNRALIILHEAGFRRVELPQD